MFGKSEWFGQLNQGKWLKPTDRNGWYYYLTWCGIVTVPSLLVWTVTDWPQALIWAAVSSVFFAWDYRKTIREKREVEAYEKLFFIDEPVEKHAETDQYVIQHKD